MKKIISTILAKLRKRNKTLTIIRKEGYENTKFVALNKTTTESYCIERERKLSAMFSALSLQ